MAEKINRFKNLIVFFLKLAIAAGLIYWMISKGLLDLTGLWQQIDAVTALQGLLLMVITIVIGNLRWLILVRAQKINLRFSQALRLSFIGLFFNYAMPGGVGGDVVKGYYLLQGASRGADGSRLPAVMSVLMDRLVGLWGMAFLALFALVVRWELVARDGRLRLFGVMLLGIFLLFLIVFVVAYFIKPEAGLRLRTTVEKLPGGTKIWRMYEAFHIYSRDPKTLCAAFALSIAAQVMSVLFMYIVGRAIQPEVDLVSYFFVIPLGFIAMALPISPAGVGVGQAALLFLFNLVLGYKSHLGPTVMTAFQVVQFLWSLVGAYFYLRMGLLNKKIQEAA